MVEAKVKSYTRKTKSGKTVQVRAHSRKCEGGSCADKKGAGKEFTDYFQLPENEQDRRIKNLRGKIKGAEKFPPPVRKKKIERIKKVADRYVNFGFKGTRRRNLRRDAPDLV